MSTGDEVDDDSLSNADTGFSKEDSGLGDFPLGVSLDGVNQAAAWKIEDYGDNGALTNEQIDDLVTRFSLTRNQLGELSWKLGWVLGGVPIMVLTSRTKAAEAAIAEIENAIKDLAAAERKLRTASGRLARMEIDNYVDSYRGREFAHARYRLAESQAVVEGIGETLRVTAETPYLALLLSTGDTRKFTDQHRDKVLSEIMTFWDQVGRKLTFTTDPITSERRGALIDFVNAVVTCVSDPPGALSGEAIIAGIKAGKKTVAFVASVLDEMNKTKRST